MVALTQCWYTRVHRPERERHRDDDGSLTSTCRYCHRHLVSWDRGHWTLADGLDVSRLVELTSGRTLTLIDEVDDLIVRRFPIRHLDCEADVDAFKQQLREQYGLDDPGSALVLRDSAPARKRKPRIQPGGDPRPDPESSPNC
jgi:hypothetical protein